MVLVFNCMHQSSHLKRGLILLPLLLLYIFPLSGQHSDANIFGDVQCEGEHIPFATIHIEGTAIGTATDVTGHYMLIDLEPGTHILVASSMGYITVKKEITINQDEVCEVNFELEEETMSIDEVVVSWLEIFGGVKNLTNAYQNDFDTLRDRDSGYVYGPGAPRTFYLGLRLHSF